MLAQTEAATGGFLFLEISQNSQENTCTRVSFSIKLQSSVCNFIEKETLAQVFSLEFCDIYKKTFFTEHFWATASALMDPDKIVTYFSVKSCWGLWTSITQVSFL